LIDYRPCQGLGRAELPGLVGRHHFCFARYQDPERLDWGRVRIWNEYRLEPGPGRPPEHCDNFDIVTIVRGGILHRPGSFGDMCLAGAGEAQILVTGSGASIGLRAIGQTASFHEIWLKADQRGVVPRCGSVPLEPGDGWHLLASGFDGDNGARLTSAARVHLARMPARGRLSKRLLGHSGRAYLVPISGSVRLGDLMMTEGSGAAILGETEIMLEAPGGAEVILVECD
jgi:redox-sensitive bicupin YhaK (pirin superfamily)